MSTPCSLCGTLLGEEYAFQKNGWPDNNTFLPSAANQLTILRDFRPHDSRLLQLRQCPECHTYYLYRTDYEFLVNGTEDEEFLTRLTNEQAQEYLQRPAGQQLEAQRLAGLGSYFAGLCQTHDAIKYYEQALAITREVEPLDRANESLLLSNIGSCYAELGQTRKALEYYEQALTMAREITSPYLQGHCLGRMGNRYAELGETQKAIEYLEQAISLARETNNRDSERVELGNLAGVLIDEGRYEEAVERALAAVKIGEEELDSPSSGSYNNWYLALAYFFAGDLPLARAAIKVAGKYHEPQNNHHVSTLLGLIALQQGAKDEAQTAFAKALTQTEAVLKNTPDYYEALEAKALAFAGLGEIENARAAYDAARKINSEPGVVGRAKRLLDSIGNKPWDTDKHG
jgi:tetratricopeptide (TPR) repeat protein